MIQRFQNNVISRSMREAVKIAEYLLQVDSKMMKELIEKNDFKYSSGSGVRIVEALIRPRELVKIQTYRPWNPWSSAIAMYQKGVISFNIYKIDKMEIKDMVGTLVHEYCHYAGFNHGTGRTANYKTKEKCLSSVPYYCSENIGKWL